MYAVTRLSFTFPKSKQLYAFFKKNDSHSYPKHYLFTKKCLLGLGLVKHLTFLYKKADFSVIVNILVKHYDAVLFKLLLHFYIFHFFQKSFFFARHDQYFWYCLKTQTFSNLPIFHSKQIITLLWFILLIATIYTRGEKRKKKCRNNSLMKSAVHLLLLRQNLIIFKGSPNSLTAYYFISKLRLGES